MQSKFMMLRFIFYGTIFLPRQLELAYINTSHPDFIGGSRAIAEVMERNRMQNGGGGEVNTIRSVISLRGQMCASRRQFRPWRLGKLWLSVMTRTEVQLPTPQ